MVMMDTEGSPDRPSDVWRTLLDLDVVRRLVREGLGCQCPETVFDDVVIGRPTVFPEPGALSVVQLLVGRRLLVSFVEIERLAEVRVDAERLLLQGRKLRDTHGLNRFRLVLVGRCQPEVMGELAAKAVEIDDRLHVHAFGLEALAALGRR